MTKIKPDDPRLKDLRLSDVIAYLERHGWEKLVHPNDRAWVFSGPLDDEGKPFKILLPRNMELLDTYLRLADAINVLADLDEQSPDEVLQRINGAEQAVASGKNTRETEATGWNWQGWLAPLAAAASIVVCIISLVQGGAFVTFIIGISLFLVAINSLLLTRLVGKLK